MVGFGQEGLLKLDGEVEECVDHGPCGWLSIWCWVVGVGSMCEFVPKTGPRPASSTPRTHSLAISSAMCAGIGEKCEYDPPARMSDG